MLLIHQPRRKLTWASSHCSWIECPRTTLTVLLSSYSPHSCFQLLALCALPCLPPFRLVLYPQILVCGCLFS